MRRVLVGMIVLSAVAWTAAPARAQSGPNHLLVNRNSGMCVEIPRANPAPGIWAVQYPCKDRPEQRWTLTRTTAGAYTVRNGASGRCLEIIDASAEDGHSVNQAVCDGTAKQLFTARPADDWVQIVTVAGLCVDIRDSSIDDGGLLIQRPCAVDASSQKWTTYGPALPSKWSGKIDLPIVPVATTTLRNGKILAWSAYDRFAYGGDEGKTYTTIYDPATNTSTERLISSTGHDMFCPGTATLPDGRILVNGGSSSAKTSIYDPATNIWTSGAQMNVPRGYQGDTLLSTGEVLTIGGSWSGGEGGKIGEVWSRAGGWRRLPGVVAETLSGEDPGGIYRADNHMWLFASSDGYAFHAGPGTQMYWIRTKGAGLVKPVGPRGDDPYSMNGNVVMYDAGKLLKLGGAPGYDKVRAWDTAYAIDFSAGPYSPVKVARQRSMGFARAFVNSVALPNGDVVVIGGQNYAELFSDYRGVYIPEIWQAKIGLFARLAPLKVPRNYHSVATLMLDGRVWVGGGGLCGDCVTNHPDAQILTPPYLLKADGSPAVRPAILKAPPKALPGARVLVTTDLSVTSFAMVRLGAVTHSVNNDQRRIAIPIEQASQTTYALKLPADRGVMLAGDWMLFAMTAAGVPSVAKIIRVQ